MKPCTLLTDYSGFVYVNSPKSPFQFQRLRNPNALHVIPRNIISGVRVKRSPCTTCATGPSSSYGMNRFNSRFNQELEPEDPFLIYLAKETLGSLRSLVQFLVEQPSQLKYIEWPSFQSTLKTASLTLVLVAILIVALCTVDSALSFLLALLLRKTV